MNKIEYTARELEQALDLVLDATHTDDYSVFVWARSAKILAAELKKRMEQDKREVDNA